MAEQMMEAWRPCEILRSYSTKFNCPVTETKEREGEREVCV